MEEITFDLKNKSDIQLYEQGKPKSLMQKTSITRSYLHAKIVSE